MIMNTYDPSNLDGFFHPETLPSAPIVSFNSLVDDIPLKDVKAKIEPVQEPQKNLMPFAEAKDVTINNVRFISDGEGTITISGTANGDANCKFALITPFIIPDGSQYQVYFLNTQSNGYYQFQNGNTYVDGWNLTPANRHSNYSGMSNQFCDKIMISVSTGTVINQTLQVMFVKNEQTVTEYIPYKPVRPITGYTECNVERTGKNLLDVDRTVGTPDPSDGGNGASPRVMDTSHYYVGLRPDNYYYPNYVAEYSVSNGEVFVRGVNNGYGVTFPVSVKPDTTYTISGAASANPYLGVGFYDKEWNYISALNRDSVTSYTFTTPSNAAYATIVLRSTDTTAGTTWSNIQLELGSSATSYEPYSGTTYTVTFPAVGKNKCSVDSVSLGGTEPRTKRVGIAPIPPGTYFVSSINTGTDTTAGHFGYQFFETSTGGVAIDQCINNETITLTATATSMYIWMNQTSYDNENTIILNNIQIEPGSSATLYEPYTTTVYSGELDVTTGELTVTNGLYNSAIFDSMDYYDQLSSGGLYYTEVNNTPAALSAQAWCNMLPQDNTGAWGDSYPVLQVSFSSLGRIRIYDNLDSLAAFKTKYADIQIVYELATPRTYQLTPQQITALLGANNVWADTGDVEVTNGEYLTAMKRYIDSY